PSALVAHRAPARAGDRDSSRSGAGQEADGRPLSTPPTYADPERRTTAGRSTHAEVATQRRLRAHHGAARLTRIRGRRADRRGRARGRVEPYGEREAGARG